MRKGEIADGQRIAIRLILIISIFLLNTMLIAQAEELRESRRHKEIMTSAFL